MIKLVKFISGEELIANVTRSENKVNLSKPALIQMVPSRTDHNQIMVGLLPYAQYARGHAIEVSAEFIIWMEEPIDELYNQYNSMYGSGIQLA